MNVDDFPNCCGAVVFNNFGYTNSLWAEPNEQQLISFQRDLERKIQNHSRYLGLILVILNNHQDGILKDIFVSAGFKEVATGDNTEHDETQPLHLYVLEIHREFAEKKEEKEDLPFWNPNVGVPFMGCNCPECVQARERDVND